MAGYLLRRAGQAVIVLFLVTVIVFVLLHLLPGGAAHAILGPRATAAQIATFNHENGYDLPLPVQYVHWLGQLAHGDLGYSYHLNQSVGSLIISRLGKTIVLNLIALIISVAVAIPIGVTQAVRRNGVFDYTATGIGFIFYSTPSFFLGLLLVLWLSVDTELFPAEAPQSNSIWQILGQPRAMVLPVLTLVLLQVSLFTRYMRSAVMDNLILDYVRTARAKGADENRVLYRHVLRNSLIPMVTILGLTLPFLLAGSLVIEQVFNFPGMGLLFYQEAQVQDYPVLLGITLIVGVATVVGSLAADVGYAILDPRVRYV